MKPLLVGESFSEGATQPFQGQSGQRLSTLLGRPWDEVFDAANLLPYTPDKEGKGREFPAEEARAAMKRLIQTDPHDWWILVGRRVASTVGRKEWPWFTEFSLPGNTDWKPHTTITKRGTLTAAIAVRKAWVVPHPSGIVTWWNDPANVDEAKAFLRRFDPLGKVPKIFRRVEA